jgi:tetratricopeptide (TPR) repeat protein
MIRERLTFKTLDVLVHVEQLVDKREFDEARQALAELLREDPRAHRSGHVAWWQAMIADYSERFEEAMNHIKHALQIDPICVPYHRSFDVIVDRIRKALASENRKPDDPSTPRLYQLLLGSAAADTECHLAMARHHAHRGDLAAALRLLDAVTTLEPTNKAAWQTALELARATGDTARGDAAASQLRALAGDAPTLFAIPGTAQG